MVAPGPRYQNQRAASLTDSHPAAVLRTLRHRNEEVQLLVIQTPMETSAIQCGASTETVPSLFLVERRLSQRRALLAAADAQQRGPVVQLATRRPSECAESAMRSPCVHGPLLLEGSPASKTAGRSVLTTHVALEDTQ